MLPVGLSVAVGPGLNTSSERRQNKRFWRGAFYAATFTFDERSAKNDEEAKKSSAPSSRPLIPPSPSYKARQSHFLFAHRSPQNMSLFVQFFGPGVAACVAERTLSSTHLFMPLLETGAYGLPKAFCGVVAINLVMSTFTMISLGMRVGKARKELAEKAKKDGDEHADERFELPKMQAE